MIAHGSLCRTILFLVCFDERYTSKLSRKKRDKKFDENAEAKVYQMGFYFDKNSVNLSYDALKKFSIFYLRNTRINFLSFIGIFPFRKIERRPT